MSIIDYYFYYYSSVFAGYPLVIKIAVFIILILLILSFISLFRFFHIRHKQLLEEKRKNKIDNKYRRKLIDLLYFSFHEVSIEDLKNDKEFPMPKKIWQNRMLTDLILNLKGDNSFEVSGGIFQSKNYYNVLTYTKLFDYWVNEISSTNSNKAIKALRMVNAIGEGVSGSAFSRSVYHRNRYLRKFARMTFSRFDAYNPYKFLEQGFDNHFNKFDEKRLHYILIEMNKDHPIPLLSKWINNSTKENYKCFLIREIGFFRQEEAIPYIVELFKAEPSIPIQCQIMKTLGELKYEPLINLVKGEFRFSTQPLQASMIDGLHRLKSKQCLPILKEAYQSTQFSEIKIQIVESLQGFGEDGVSILTSLSTKRNSEFENNLFDFALN